MVYRISLLGVLSILLTSSQATQNTVCPSYEGSYQATNEARFPIDNEYILYTEDPDARLTELQYCLFMNAAGTTHTDYRGWKATFTNSETSTTEVFSYGDVDQGNSVYGLDCRTVTFSNTIQSYNWD